MFPTELTNLNQWLVWRFEPNGDKKPRKVPYYANGTRRHGKQGDEADRDALTSYEKAKSALEYGYQGLGFAFLPDDGLIGIDIDANADKELAAKIIGGCNSYTELSPSGNGWHIFVKGETKTFKDNDVGIEVFCSSQFFTMTGDKIPESPDTIAPISDKLINRLREIVKPEKPKPTRTSLPINERAKVESALAYINADCGYDDWYKIGMAIYSELGAGGFSVWDYWSAKSSKYSPKGMQEKYASFAGSAVKGATLYGMAIDNGWQPPRDPNYRPTQQPTQPKPTQQTTTPVSIDLFSPLVDVNDKGKPLETIENLADVCRRLGINITYNVISKSVDIAIPNNKTTIDNEYNANLAMLKSWCKRFKMPTDSLKDYVLAIADGNVFNPVQTWIESVLWDKKPRLNEFFATVSDKTKKILPDGRSLKDVLIFRWMLSAVAVALTEKPIAAQGVLTFTGKGNLGKTEWFKNLLPEEMRFLLKEGLTLNPSDKDSVTTCISHWLCELGELDGTFRRADVAQLKAFITRSQDDVRRPYAASDSKYPRRTVLFASVNSREYLQDPTGNRRFWTIEVDKINARHGMNMQQVWAEVAYCYRDLGQKWFLEPDEMDALNEHNDDFMSINPTHEKIDTAFEWEQSPVFWTHPCTATEIAELSGIERITQRETNEASSYVQQRYAVQTKRIGANKNKRWMMPPLTFEAEQALAKTEFQKMIECNHIGNRVYTKRIFQNLTTHYCVQCLNCGQIVRQNNKLWLKIEDIPPTKTIHIFDEFFVREWGKQMITLRDYQKNAVDSIRQSYAQQRRAPLLVLPTGGGKTTIFAYVTQQAASKGKCVFLLCHRAELVKQISTTLANFGCHHQVIAPHAIVNQCRNSQFLELGESFIAPCRVYVASVQTLVKRMDKIIHTPDIIVIDEAHHLTQGSTWGKVIDAYPKARLLPVTATPCRLDGKGLGVDDGGYADDIIIGQTMGNLIANKYLSEYRIFCPPNALDLSNVKTRMGDYSKDDLAEAMDKPTITGDAVMHYRKLCNNRRAVVFCVTVAHAEHVRDSFNVAGIASESLDGTLDPNERDARIKRFESGLTLVLTSCDVVSEGFDLPSIECAILLRPTKSLSLYLQQVGRALRVTKGKTEAIILDHVGAAMRHGLPDTEREWTLEGRKKKPRKNDNDEPDVNIKTCPSCYAVHDSKLKQCPVCNHVYVVVKTQIQVNDGELVELDKSQIILQRKTEVKNARDFDSLVALGRSRQYKYPEQWAAKQIEIRGQYAERRN